MWKRSVCVLLERFHVGGCESSVWHRGITWPALLQKANQPLVISACLRVLTPTGPRTVSGLRETLAFELLPCHFLLSKQKQREDKRVLTTHSCIRCEITSISSSIHPVRMDECAHDNQATRQALLVRHSSTPTMASGLSSKLRVSRPRHVSLFKSTAAFTTTTPDLEFKHFFFNTVDPNMSLFSKSQYII